MTAAGDSPTPAELDPADREMLVSRVVAAARQTPQDAAGRRLLVNAAGAVVIVAAVALAGVLVAVRLPGPTALESGPTTAEPTPSATSPTPSPSQPPTGAPSPGRMTWGLGGLSFTTPAGWHLTTAHRWTMPIGPIAFLSNAPVADPCSTELLQGDACWRPLAALPADGVLVTFSGSATLTTRDMWGKVTTAPPSARCAALGGEEQMGAVFGGFGVAACLRGPDLSAGEDAFRQIVASLLASAEAR